MFFTCLRIAVTVGMLGSAIALANQPQGRVMSHTDRQLLTSFVGQIPRKCCLWGRRWGCDPVNFNQTGCVQINLQLPNCWSAPPKTMKCTSASCQAGGTEDVCNVDYRQVGLNTCRPTGSRTTTGCPANYWQCYVAMRRYDHSTAPKIDALVCEDPGATICPYSYSKCN
jgi:hypothetical protein